jgi:hypothetical protein
MSSSRLGGVVPRTGAKGAKKARLGVPGEEAAVMMVSLHALMGAALSRLCPGPKQAFLLGLGSHLVADMIPHHDLDLLREGLLLGGVMGLLGYTQGVQSREFAGAVGAILPDAESAVAALGDLEDGKLILPNHSLLHGREVSSIRMQVLLGAACIAVLAIGGGRRAEGGREGTA